MTHALSIAFFFGLLLALVVLLEITFRSHWAAISAALRGAPAPRLTAPVRRPRQLGAAA